MTLTKTLGSGAFGVVYRGVMESDTGQRRDVAVKLFLQDFDQPDLFLARMRDEARLLALINDDRIIQVYDLVHIEGREAVIMEAVDGVDISWVIQSRVALPPRAVAELGSVVAGALYRAHQARHPDTHLPLNVVHRDVKPANIMVSIHGGVKLLDFGIARSRFDTRESRTGQMVLGTLDYMAPESILKGEVSPAVDIYGLGVLLWEAATCSHLGQVRVKREKYEVQIAAALEAIPSTHGLLVPILGEMLAWDPALRPDGCALEWRLMELARAFPLPGLKTWASEIVPDLFSLKTAVVTDPAGLMGQTVSLEPHTARATMAGSRHAMPVPFVDGVTSAAFKWTPQGGDPSSAWSPLAPPRTAPPATAPVEPTVEYPTSFLPIDPVRSVPRVEEPDLLPASRSQALAGHSLPPGATVAPSEPPHRHAGRLSPRMARMALLLGVGLGLLALLGLFVAWMAQ